MTFTSRSLPGNVATLDQGWAHPGGPEPFDLLSTAHPPALPEGLLPQPIEDFARAQGRLTGADPAGLAMAALTVCAAALTDDVCLQPKVHDQNWRVPARIWTALVGAPSTKKSPILAAASAPLKRIDAKLARDYARQLAEHEQLPKKERDQQRPPPQKRKRIEDTTIEAAQEVLKDNPEGVLCLQDELSGWLGSMEKYGGQRAGMKDRAFWLQAFNGGAMAINRVGRGSTYLDNASVSVLGGVQPEPIRKVAREAHDDGLLQRFFPIVLRDADVDRDEPPGDAIGDYAAVVTALTQRRPLERWGYDGEPEPTPLRFDAGAQQVERQVAQEERDLSQLDLFHPQLGAHLGKTHGLFARLALLFHAIDHAHADTLPLEVPADTAERAWAFMARFLRPHAVAFYHGTLGVQDGHDELGALAGHILAAGCEQLTARDVTRACRALRGATKDDVRQLMDRLEVAGWVTEADTRRSDQLKWDVNPAVHVRFADHADRESRRRHFAHQQLQALKG